MRDAVDATGRKVEEFEEDEAAVRGYVSTLKCLRRRGVLKDECLLCAAASMVGDLEALKALRRAENVPLDVLYRDCIVITSVTTNAFHFPSNPCDSRESLRGSRCSHRPM
jgi:hypothetical protein